MIRVGVLRGGTGNQYDQSLASGAFVLRSLPKDQYEAIDIFIDREGVWHLNGIPAKEEDLVNRIDVVWNALHGFYGEDGKVQKLLGNLGIPYIGSDAAVSEITMDKKLLRENLASQNIKTPRGIYIEDWGVGDREETVLGVVRTVAEKLSPPWIIEPISRGQGNGGIRANTREELVTVLSHMYELRMSILVEEMVFGKEVSVSTATDFRGEPIYAFLPNQTDSAHSRMQGAESEMLQKLAKEIHKNMRLGHYSRVEATITPKGHIYVRNISTLPALHADSDLHTALENVGASFKEFAKNIISKAMSLAR